MIRAVIAPALALLVLLALPGLAFPALAQDTMPPAPYAYNQLDDPALEAEAAALMISRAAAAHPEAVIKGVLVQKMESGLAEILIGYRLTPEAGPIVTVAPGGTLAASSSSCRSDGTSPLPRRSSGAITRSRSHSRLTPPQSWLLTRM